MNDRQFRTAMGSFATGVTVITVEHNGDIHGMTANAFMSVSLDPKLVVISIREEATILNKIKESQNFTVNILAADQQELSMYFAGQIKEPREVVFDRLDGKPVLAGACAQVVCEVSTEHVEGDHILFIGKVTNIHLEDKEPLLYVNGKYHTLAGISTS
ncbi:flavin reductase family protein [Psychrobacillus sp. NPDC096426]|uniref:flavin reductase family protein n=1 Tax=Psychrobacillus sp. NPDC096426 TaxID=3364491 RepID=UPI00380006CC